MSCQIIKTPSGTIIANVKPGEKLTVEDKQILAEYVEFCRVRRAKKLSKLLRKTDGK